MIKAAVFWLGLPCLILLCTLTAEQPTRPVARWTEDGPVAVAATPQVASDDPLSWVGPRAATVILRMADIVVLSVPGFLAWLLMEFVEDRDRNA